MPARIYPVAVILLVCRVISGLAVLIVGPILCIASEFSGPVVSVLDGDTIEVLHDQHLERIRLHGIDCPERGQPFGHKAKQAMSALVFGQDVTLQTHGKDRYKRILADVFLSDGTHVNHELVKEGWCWWYRKYAPKDIELKTLEEQARQSKKGLWGERAPVPPWEWRRDARAMR